MQYTKGAVTVSKLKIVLDTLDVNPAHVKFVVVMAFETYKLPVMTAEAFDRVIVFAKRFVVVTAFEA